MSADVVSISNAAADVAGIPRLLLLAAGCAESGLNPFSRRPTSAPLDATYWPDVSFGVWQQTVRWASEYTGGAAFPGAAEIARVGALYLDPQHAATVAARQLKAHYKPGEDDAIFKALCRYNRPALDGAPASAAVAANYRRGIADATKLLGDQPMPDPSPSTIKYEDYRDPQPAGRFTAMPKGIILHGSRSGKAGNPKATEYLGTARYEVANTDELGWNATVGENVVAVHLTPNEWGWNARAASSLYLGVEFAQATVDEAISDAQVAAFVDWVKTRVLPSWGSSFPLVFPTHAELDGTAEYGGYHDGKSDAFPKNDGRAADLRARIMAGLQGTQPAPSTDPGYSVGPGILAAMQAHGDQPASDEMYTKSDGRDMYSEAYGRSGARYVYLFAVNRTFRYEPAA